MSSQVVAGHRENAEVYTGEGLCKQKSRELLEEICLPKKKRKQHKFQRIGRNVSYDTEVTAFVEKQRMKKLTGVKSKELLIWVTISDIYIDDPSSGKIAFGNSTTGISRSFPVSAFDLDESNGSST
ncbi:hypothetical protein CK203_080901 [Vitis vinifera]|uniref:Uncharacterized protein n=1 Tax=Vitis vinifera TaxID=29760 RepID=A0A438C0B4_VITVI|nr:hypothetical protein CK203_080901 [Vitis vinifera]